MLLAYDTFPPGSDLSPEFSAEGVTLTFTAQRPTHRAREQARRFAARLAAWDCASVSTAVIGIGGVLLIQMGRRGNLTPIVFVLGAIFIGAVYLLNWKSQIDRINDLLEAAHQKTTVITATDMYLIIEQTGATGSSRQQIAAGEISEIVCSRRRVKWWLVEPNTLDLIGKHGLLARLLPWRDEAEHRVVGQILGGALRLPEKVVSV